jgi:hypothetical protein
MANVATPEPLRVTAVPRAVTPSMKITEPVGTPAPGATALTVSVRVIDAPVSEGLDDEVSELDVVATFTVNDSVELRDALKLLTPP